MIHLELGNLPDVLDCVLMFQMVEIRMKKLLKMPATMPPPPPERVISGLSWVKDDPELVEYIKVRHLHSLLNSKHQH